MFFGSIYGQDNVIVPVDKYHDINPNALPDQVLKVRRFGDTDHISAIPGEIVVPCHYSIIKKIDKPSNSYLVEYDSIMD